MFNYILKLLATTDTESTVLLTAISYEIQHQIINFF